VWTLQSAADTEPCQRSRCAITSRISLTVTARSQSTLTSSTVRPISASPACVSCRRDTEVDTGRMRHRF
jgi:hypothetical protein